MEGAIMATMTASVGEQRGTQGSNTALKAAIYKSIEQLSRWLEENDYRGYDTFRWPRFPIYASTYLRDQLPAHSTPARRETVSCEFASRVGNYQGTLHQRHGFFGARLHAASQNDWRPSVEGQS